MHTRETVDAIETQRRLLNEFKKVDISIFDVGANKGQTATKYRSAFPGADIYCFEPFPDSITVLQKQFADDEKVHIIAKAMGQENGIATFFVNELSVTNSLLPRPSSARRYYPKSAGPKGTIKVEVIELDGFSREKGVSTIDILKLDIQGGELNALRGAEAVVSLVLRHLAVTRFRK